MRMLVTGASGYIGSLLVPRLLADGHSLVALARDPSRLPGSAEGLQVVAGDVLTGVGLARSLEGAEVAYYLIHSMEASRGALRADALTQTDQPSFTAREALAAENFAAQARRAGVGRIVYLGGLMPRKLPASRHMASRAAVQEILMDAVPDSVALRASIVIGARSRSFRLLVRLVERMPVIALPPWREFRTQPIDARDVTDMLIAAASAPAVGGRSLDVGGPEPISYGRMIERIAELMLLGRPRLQLALDLTPIAARLAAAIAGEDPQLTVPLMESLRQGDLLPRTPTAARRAARQLGVTLHSFDASVERALRDWESIEPLTAH